LLVPSASASRPGRAARSRDLENAQQRQQAPLPKQPLSPPRFAPLYFYKPEQHLNTRKQYCHADKTKLDMLDGEVAEVFMDIFFKERGGNTLINCREEAVEWM